MSRRPASSFRRLGGSSSFPFAGMFRSKSKSSPLLSLCFVVVGAFLLIGYACGGPGIFKSAKSNKIEGDYSCTLELQRAIPALKKVYGDSMHKVLHVGPDTCSVVTALSKEDDTEAFGVEPYDMEDADVGCKTLVHRGVVRVADLKFPLPYRSKSFSLVVVSDALDYLSPKYLNKTVPELARVASDGLVLFAGNPGQRRAQVAELSKFGRPAKVRSSSWWVRFFAQTNMEANGDADKKFKQVASKTAYEPKCQIFHLKSLH